MRITFNIWIEYKYVGGYISMRWCIYILFTSIFLILHNAALICSFYFIENKIIYEGVVEVELVDKQRLQLKVFSRKKVNRFSSEGQTRLMIFSGES